MSQQQFGPEPEESHSSGIPFDIASCRRRVRRNAPKSQSVSSVPNVVCHAVNVVAKLRKLTAEDMEAPVVREF